MTTRTIMDVLHIQMNARHQYTDSLRTLVVQQLHHLREPEMCEQAGLHKARENRDVNTPNTTTCTHTCRQDI